MYIAVANSEQQLLTQIQIMDSHLIWQFANSTSLTLESQTDAYLPLKRPVLIVKHSDWSHLW
jgi:hypothetical protein